MTQKNRWQCCQCSLPAWKGMFCPTCGAVASGELVAKAKARYKGMSLAKVAEVLGGNNVMRLAKEGGAITKPIAETILACLPHNAELFHKGEEVKRRVVNKLNQAHEQWEKTRQNQQPEIDEPCPL